MRNPPDTQSETIRFGVELETSIPENCGIEVGGYHSGRLVTTGLDASGRRIPPPAFGLPPLFWRADNDASIRNEAGFKSAEFVSPILHGMEGVVKLLEFVDFLRQIGACVNASCGCHITVGIPSVIGTDSATEIAGFIRKLSRLVTHHEVALYAQTGTARHESNYSLPLPHDTGEETNHLKRDILNLTSSQIDMATRKLGRGIVNFRKALPSDLSRSAVEFRVFAGTVNRLKLMHHLACVLGLCRRAATTKRIPPFHKPDRKTPADAPAALRRLWSFLGWGDDDAGADTAFGQFGPLHELNALHCGKALEMAQKFQDKHPDFAERIAQRRLEVITY